MNWYIPSIVPAPPGWLQNGSADPGDEFYYTHVHTDGGYPGAEVYPGEYPDGEEPPQYSSSGWVLHIYLTAEQHHSVPEQYIAGFPTPTAAFNAYAEFVCDTPEDRNPDGTLAHSECACPTEDN
jgi:hypothetical protein